MDLQSIHIHRQREREVVPGLEADRGIQSDSVSRPTVVAPATLRSSKAEITGKKHAIASMPTELADLEVDLEGERIQWER